MRVVVLNRLVKYALGAAIIFVVAGCSSSGVINPPVELQDIEKSVTISTQWSHSLSAPSDSGLAFLVPVYIENKVYAAGYDGELIALDAESGEQLWQYQHGENITAAVGVGDGMVLVGDAQGNIVAIDAVGGDLKWAKSLSIEILAAPVAVNGVVVVKAADGRVFGIESKTQEIRWITPSFVPSLTLRGAGQLQVSGSFVLVPLDDGRLLALDVSTGQEVWSVRVSSASGRSEVARLSDMDSTPVLVGRDIYATAYQGNLAAIDQSSGRVQWMNDFSSFVGVDASISQVTAVDDESIVWLFRSTDGLGEWKNDQLKYRWLSKPVMLRSVVVVGDYDGYLHVLSKNDGSIIGRRALCSGQVSTLAALSDSSFLLACSSGKISYLNL